MAIPVQVDQAFDAAYHEKYDRFGPAIVGTVVGPIAAGVTIRLRPAAAESAYDRRWMVAADGALNLRRRIGVEQSGTAAGRMEVGPPLDRRGRPVVRRFVLTVLMAGALALTGGGVVAADPGAAAGQAGNAGNGRFPETIDLPAGFRPEGISIGSGTNFYVGSVSTGAIYRGSVRTGAGAVLVPAIAGGAAIGTEVDQRNRLWVAGGATGFGRVYDANSGRKLRSYAFVDPAVTPTFVNDDVVTRDAAYFTDSLNKVLYVVPFGRGGRLPDNAYPLPISGDLQLATGNNLNGIEASADGRTLVAVQSNTGLLFTISPTSGGSKQIDLGGLSLVNGDGLLRRGPSTLYVVQNRFNTIAVLKLDRSFASGALVDTITNPNLDVPTTIAAFGNSLYAVNPRFGVTNPDSVPYSVVRVDARR